MPRNISFSLTTDRVRNRRKTVTRRTGWQRLKVGDILNACVKCMGLKPGEKIERICRIQVISIRQEPLSQMLLPGYGDRECELEGFQGMTGAEFVEKFCKSHQGCTPESHVTRIEFQYLD
jgi:hypothetical protein